MRQNPTSGYPNLALALIRPPLAPVTMEAMPGNIGPLEIGIVLIIALLVFGPKRLPELGSSLGRGIREFKETITGDRKDDGEDDDPKALHAATATKPPATATKPPESTPVATAPAEKPDDPS